MLRFRKYVGPEAVMLTKALNYFFGKAILLSKSSSKAVHKVTLHLHEEDWC